MPDALLAELQHHLLAMPPVACLQPRIDRADDDVLALQAPLAANVNDKGCAFGGSLVSLMTLAGWGLTTLHVRRAGLQAEVYVADSTIRYRAPVFEALRAEARAEDAASWAGFIDALRGQGRAELRIAARIGLADGSDACRMQARYVAIAAR